MHDRTTGAVLDVNDRMCEMHGYTREEFLALEVEDFSAGMPIHVQANAQRLIQKAAADGPQTFRWLSRRKDGTLFWVEVHLRRAELEGETRIVATVRDVDDRVRSEAGTHASERLQEVMQELPVYVFVQDRNLRYTWVSHTVTGVDPTHNVGKTDEAFLPEEEAMRIRAVKERVLKTGAPAHVEMQGTLAGQRHFFETHLVPKRDETGATTGLLGATVDITARKQKADQFRLLVEEVEEYAIFMLDPEGHVITWNAGAEKIKGYRKEEVLGRHFSVFYTAEDVEAGLPEAALETACSEGQWKDERWRVRKDGTRFWAHVSLTALHDEAGQLQGFTKVTRDLRERREREEVLRRSEKRYRRLFEAAQEGIAITTPAGDIIDMNPAGCKILGYSREEVRAMKAEDLYVDPEHRRRAIATGIESGASAVRDVEWHLRRKDGEEIVILLSTTIQRGPEGEIETFLTFFHDITERKRAEEALRESEARFRALTEKSLVGIAMLQEGGYQYVNPAFARIFGYTPEELIDRSPAMLFHPDDWPRVRENLRKRYVGEKREAHYEARIVTKEGQIRFAEVMGSRFMYRGEPAVIGTVMDITERRHLEEDLLQIQEEERRRFGRELHDGVASDLTGVALIPSSLTRKARKGEYVRPEALEEVVGFINQAIQAARALSRGLSPVGLERGLPYALKELVERTREHAELSCSFEMTDVLPPLSEETATHLYRIAQEALSNAVRHAEASHIEVGLFAEDETLTLVVQDNGRGGLGLVLDEEGLGMRTMRYRANLTGSILHIEEAAGGGTRVQCRLPVRYDHTAAMNL